MLSEFRTIGSWQEPVVWEEHGEGREGRLHVALWGELPQGPLPHDAPFDRKDLKPSHIIGELVWDEIGDDVSERRESFRVRRGVYGDWDRLWEGDGDPSWPDILEAASDALSADIDGAELSLREDGR